MMMSSSAIDIMYVGSARLVETVDSQLVSDRRDIAISVKILDKLNRSHGDLISATLPFSTPQ